MIAPVRFRFGNYFCFLLVVLLAVLVMNLFDLSKHDYTCSSKVYHSERRQGVHAIRGRLQHHCLPHHQTCVDSWVDSCRDVQIDLSRHVYTRSSIVVHSNDHQGVHVNLLVLHRLHTCYGSSCLVKDCRQITSFHAKHSIA